jgi:hypothetical protein
MMITLLELTDPHELPDLILRLHEAGFSWGTSGTGHSVLVQVKEDEVEEARKFLANAGSGI